MTKKTPSQYVEQFKSFMGKNPDLSVGIAVISILTCVVQESSCTTMSGIDREIGGVTEAIQKAIPDLPLHFKCAANMFKAIIAKGSEIDYSKWKQLFETTADEQLEAAKKTVKDIPYVARPFFQHGMTIMTRGYDPLVISCLARPSEIKFNIFVAEGSPQNDGLKLANALAKQSNHQITLIPDSAIGTCMHSTTIVMFGADVVLDNGAIVGTVGTYSMAALANINKCPVYCVCESFKFLRSNVLLNPNDLGDLQRPIKYRPEGDIDDNVQFYSDKYDITPAKYVTMLITEKGPIPPAAVTHELTKLLGVR